MLLSGCAERQEAGQEENQVRDASDKMQIAPYRLGDATIEPDLEAGKELNTKATVTNIGTENDPEYKVRAFIGNKGDTVFAAPMVFGFFEMTSEQAQIAAEEKGLETQIVTMSSLNMIGTTIDPGYGTEFVFASGENTTELVRLNGGYLRFHIEIMTDPFETGTGELLVYAVNDLPTVMDDDGEASELPPGACMEIPLYKVGVDI